MYDSAYAHLVSIHSNASFRTNLLTLCRSITRSDFPFLLQASPPVQGGLCTPSKLRVAKDASLRDTPSVILRYAIFVSNVPETAVAANAQEL